MMWFILGAVLLVWLVVKWSLMAIMYMAIGILWVGAAMFRLVTNRWPV
jgi:hypothetical protein